MASHNHLPAEVLATIFLFCLPRGFRLTVPYPPVATADDVLLPWNLSQVCSRWRHVALHERRLWNRLLLQDNYETERKHFPLMAETILARSGQASLNLMTVFISERSMKMGSPIETYIIPHIHRLTVLWLHLHPQYMRDFLSLPSGMLPLLQESSLYLSAIEARDFLPENDVLMFKDIPGLFRFETCIVLPAITNSPNSMNLPWPQLTHLVIACVRILPKDLYDILRQTPLLVSCNLAVDQDPAVRHHFSELRLEPIALGHLQDMFLEVYDSASEATFLDILTTPKLISFTYKFTSNIGQLFVPAIEIPAFLERSLPPLAHLRFMYGPRYGDLGPIIQYTPSLLSLEAPLAFLTSSTMGNIASGTWIPKIERLEFCIDAEDSEDCLDMLREHWAQRTLETDFDDEASKGIQALTLYINGADESFAGEFLNDLSDFLPHYATATINPLPLPPYTF